MQSLVEPKQLQEACDRARAAGQRVALVPTMGALHAGHMALVAAARERADFVVVSIFVNPTQFGPQEDLNRYPRTLEADRERCHEAGVAAVFAPGADGMYRPGDDTRVQLKLTTQALCGAHRPGHFDGVSTIVTKLLHLSGPCLAVFGRKDYQQWRVVNRLVSDLFFPVRLHGVKVRDLGSRNGTQINDVRLGEVCVTAACTVRVGATEIHFEPVRPERVTVPPVPAFGPLVGHSEEMRKIFDRLTKIASTDLTLLILGETGTGKELAAKAVHLASGRKNKPFIVVDCGSIPPSLAESSLFGHERGSFTGAIDKQQSPFHDAEGGTLFLDELGELPLDVQPKLLRALSERRVKSVGGSTYKPFDARVVAATRRELVRAVNAGAFRSDLYFRVAQVKVNLPPLRQRFEDIPIMVRAMLKDLGGEEAYHRVSNQTLERLMRYDWPGNVRELRNAVEVAYALSDADAEIDIAAHLGALTDGLGPGSQGSIGRGLSASYENRPFQEAKREVLAEFARAYFSKLAEQAKGNVSEMARRAGMERAHVRTYLKRHDIDVKQYR